MFEILGKSLYLAFANSCPTDIEGRKQKSSSSYPQVRAQAAAVAGSSHISGRQWQARIHRGEEAEERAQLPRHCGEGAEEHAQLQQMGRRWQ